MANYLQKYKKYKHKYKQLLEQYGGQNIEDMLANISSNFVGYGYLVCYKNNKIIYEKSFGYTDKDNNILWNNKSQHRIGSITKVFAALAIVLLIQDGKLKITDTIDKFGLAKLPNSDKITIDHLINHKSGVYNASFDHYYRGENYDFKLNPQDIKPLDINEMIDNIIKHKSCFSTLPKECFQAGEKFSYSNTAYYLLGYIIKYIMNQSPIEYIKKHILDKLNLNNTTFHLLQQNTTKIYQQDETPGYFENHGEYGLNANIISTACDLHKFIMNYKILLKDEYYKLFSSFYFFKNGILKHTGAVDYDDNLYNISKSIIYSKNDICVIAFSNKIEPKNNLIESLDKILDK
jgi:CubicO group peptidase (beta-lactamase class C family)